MREDVPDTLPALFEKAEFLLRCPVTPWHDIIYKEDKGKCRACARAGLAPARHQFTNDRRDRGILASDSQFSP